MPEWISKLLSQKAMTQGIRDCSAQIMKDVNVYITTGNNTDLIDEEYMRLLIRIKNKPQHFRDTLF